MKVSNGPRILFIDIETSPLEVMCWGLFDQNIGLNQVIKDSSVLSWAAKWSNEDKVMYMDTRAEKDPRNDINIIKDIWLLLDEADIVIGQNHKRFDIKRLNAKFKEYKLGPPSSYKTIDVLTLNKKNFAYTSNKLEYITNKYNIEYTKLSHSDFPGMSLWTECLKGNKKAWNSMEKYNKHDVLSLEEYYNGVKAWDNSINFNVYTDSVINTCTCGNKSFKKNGFHYTSTGKFQRMKCSKCGHETKDKVNLFSKDKKASLRK